VICYKSSKESEGGVDIVTAIAIAIGVIAVIGLAATIIVVKKKN
jgi:hypothetical protein